MHLSMANTRAEIARMAKLSSSMPNVQQMPILFAWVTDIVMICCMK